MKSLNIDIIFPWEFGLGIIIISLIIIGVKQSKKEVVYFDKMPLINPTTKIFFGSEFLYIWVYLNFTTH